MTWCDVVVGVEARPEGRHALPAPDSSRRIGNRSRLGGFSMSPSVPNVTAPSTAYDMMIGGARRQLTEHGPPLDKVPAGVKFIAQSQ